MSCASCKSLCRDKPENLYLSLNNRLNQGVLAMGKTAGRQPVGLVESANSELSEEVSGYCVRPHTPGLMALSHTLNTVYLTGEHMHVFVLTVGGHRLKSSRKCTN